LKVNVQTTLCENLIFSKTRCTETPEYCRRGWAGALLSRFLEGALYKFLNE